MRHLAARAGLVISPTLVALVSAIAATANTISVPLPGLLGHIPPPAALFSRSASFDLGFGFQRIDSVSLELEASVTAMQVVLCGFEGAPQPCELEYFLGSFIAFLDPEDPTPTGSVFTAIRFSEDRDIPDASGVAASPFQNSRIGWDFLLDGRGSLEIFWNRTILVGDPILGSEPVDEIGDITGARLIVDGIPVPEPSPMISLFTGLLVLAAAGRRSSSTRAPR
jgi:hypothetical protein